MHPQDFPRAGFFRRFATIIYDLLVVLALLMIAGAFLLLIIEGCHRLGWVDYGDAIDVSDYMQKNFALTLLYPSYLMAVWLGFYVYFWSMAGQTLGMRAWRLQVQTVDGLAITPAQALVRAITALLGLGNLLCVIPKLHALQDYISKTRVVVTPKVR